MKPLSFLHAGQLGDMVFALAAIKRLGGGALYVHPKLYGCAALDNKPHAAILPLLRSQPYVSSIRMWKGEPVDYDLRDFPNHALNPNNTVRNLVDCHMGACQLPDTDHSQPWLIVKPRKLHEKQVIISRSALYINPRFDWHSILRHHRKRAIFLGLPKEYARFKNKFGADINFEPTENLYEVAELVAGADLFIGNQCVPFAIAEGLKKPVILEASATHPSCVFPRKGIRIHWCGLQPKFTPGYNFSVKTDSYWEY